MNITEYENKRIEYGIEGTGINSTVKIDKTWFDKKTKAPSFTLKAGSKVKIDFSPKKYPGSIFVTIGSAAQDVPVEHQVKVASTQTAHKYFTGFTKPPSLNTLEKRQFDGISKTVTGKKVEPDGYSYDGSPSWELVLGLI